MRTVRITLAVTILSVNVLLAAPPSAVQGLPPMCTPTPPVIPFAILYRGLTSGCNNQGGNGPECLAGETIKFSAGNQQITCPPTEYSWQFPDSSGPAPWTVNHVFPDAGVFTVNVTITNSNGVGHLSQSVAIEDLASVPALVGPLELLLIGAFALIAAYRLK